MLNKYQFCEKNIIKNIQEWTYKNTSFSVLKIRKYTYK